MSKRNDKAVLWLLALLAFWPSLKLPIGAPKPARKIPPRGGYGGGGAQGTWDGTWQPGDPYPASPDLPVQPLPPNPLKK